MISSVQTSGESAPDTALQEIMETVPCGMIYSIPLRDGNGRICDFQVVLCNTTIVEMTGFSRHRILTETMLTCDPISREGTIFTRWVKVAETRRATEFEHFFARGGRWMRIKLTPYREGVLATYLDVTSEYRQRLLVQKNDLLRTLIDMTQVAIALLAPVRDINGTVIDFRYELTNEANSKLTKVPISSMLGGRLKHLFPGVKDSDLFPLMLKVLDTAEPAYLRMPYDHDNIKGIFDFRIVRVDSSDGYHILFSVLDVTEAESIHRQVYDKAELLQSVLNASHDSIVAVDAVLDKSGVVRDFVYVMMNEAGENTINRKLEDIQGKGMLEVFPANRDTGLFDIYLDVWYTGRPRQVEQRYEADGISGWFLLSVVRRESGLLITITNTTPVQQARQEAQRQAELLKSVLDSSRNMIIVLEPVRKNDEIVDYRFVLQNEAHRRLMGLKDEELPLRTFSEMLDECNFNQLLALLTRVLQSGEPLVHDFQAEHKGHTLWYNLSAVKEVGHERVVVTMVDVTAEKVAQQGLEEHRRDLEKANAELSRSNAELQFTNENLQQFAYVASHDLQEPLRKIQAFGDLLVAQYATHLPDEGKVLVQRMQSASGRMAVLIRDILAYSRVSTRSQRLELVGLNEVVAQVRADILGEINGQEAHIHVEQLPNIRGDRSQLWQLFQNLISNALKFHQPGGCPTVLIKARLLAENLPENLPVPAGKPWWEISVEDNGIGFEQQYAERLFQLFQRLHGRDRYPGTGIGLAICKRIVDRHGGVMTAHGKLGEGAVFRIYLPVSEE